MSPSVLGEGGHLHLRHSIRSDENSTFIRQLVQCFQPPITCYVHRDTQICSNTSIHATIRTAYRHPVPSPLLNLIISVLVDALSSLPSQSVSIQAPRRIVVGMISAGCTPIIGSTDTHLTLPPQNTVYDKCAIHTYTPQGGHRKRNIITFEKLRKARRLFFSTTRDKSSKVVC